MKLRNKSNTQSNKKSNKKSNKQSSKKSSKQSNKKITQNKYKGGGKGINKSSEKPLPIYEELPDNDNVSLSSDRTGTPEFINNDVVKLCMVCDKPETENNPLQEITDKNVDFYYNKKEFESYLKKQGKEFNHHNGFIHMECSRNVKNQEKIFNSYNETGLNY